MQFVSEVSKSFKITANEDEVMSLIFFMAEDDPRHQIRQSELVAKKIKGIFEKDPGKKHGILIDITLIKTSPTIVKQARDNYSRIASMDQAKKIAVVAEKSFYRTAVSLIARAAGKEFKWFPSRKKAIDWLMTE